VGSEAAEVSGRRAKLGRAATLPVRDPGELYEVLVDRAHRTTDPLRRRPTLEVTPFEEVAARLDAALAGRVSESLREDALAEIDAEVRERVGQLGTALPFSLDYNATPSLANLCYALVRALRPATVLETGVAYGVSSSFIAQALSVNGEGELHSVDRPAVQPGVEDYIGALVPERLRSRWTLHRGTSRRLLPHLLPEIGGVSLFVHDSQHTYRNVTWELRTVTPHLTRSAAVLVDDTAGTRAFEHWVERTRPAFSAVVAEQWVGVAVL
jgi:cephalosporin hydroxylase